jgi:uncharacterized protein YbjT (DUF2867 family)
MILITTPTGDIGAWVLGHLSAAGAKVRIIARNPARLPADLVDRVHIIEGSHADMGWITFLTADATQKIEPHAASQRP